jgi:hypothetical protein
VARDAQLSFAIAALRRAVDPRRRHVRPAAGETRRASPHRTPPDGRRDAVHWPGPATGGATCPSAMDRRRDVEAVVPLARQWRVGAGDGAPCGDCPDGPRPGAHPIHGHGRRPDCAGGPRHPGDRRRPRPIGACVPSPIGAACGSTSRPRRPKGVPGFTPLWPLYEVEHAFAQLGRCRRPSCCLRGHRGERDGLTPAGRGRLPALARLRMTPSSAIQQPRDRRAVTGAVIAHGCPPLVATRAHPDATPFHGCRHEMRTPFGEGSPRGWRRWATSSRSSREPRDPGIFEAALGLRVAL